MTGRYRYRGDQPLNPPAPVVQPLSPPFACTHPPSKRVEHRTDGEPRVGPAAETCGKCDGPVVTRFRPELANVRGAGAVLLFGHLLGGA